MNARYAAVLTACLCLGGLVCACGKSEPAAEAAVISLPVEEEQEQAADKQAVEILITPAPTPAPTPVPTPTLPPVTACKPVKGYTSKSGVNLRAKPTTEADILDTLDRAAAFTITGEAGTWYQVELGEDTGFISQEFVGQGEVPPILTIEKVKRRNGVTTASKVNMRKGPSTKEELLQKLDVFTPFTITGENEKWYEIEYEGTVGYVSKEYAQYSQGYYAQEDLYLVAQLVHQEAKNTTLEGKIAVANVVYNRIRSSKYPNTITKVVFQKGQFSPADNESKLRSVRASSNSIKAVLEIFVKGETILPRNVLYFRAARLGKEWTSARTYYNTYGSNCFFK